jgi:hypothetical protein
MVCILLSILIQCMCSLREKIMNIKNIITIGIKQRKGVNLYRWAIYLSRQPLWKSLSFTAKGTNVVVYYNQYRRRQ